MDDSKEIESMYMKYAGEKQSSHQISKNVWYLGYFGSGFGEIPARQQLWRWRKAHAKIPHGVGFLRSQAWQEQALDKALGALKDCLILSTTASYFSQLQGACLLKSRGFQLLQGRCYKHPGYLDSAIKKNPMLPDGFQHYEHVWWKVQGKVDELGLPDVNTHVYSVNNCGIDFLVGVDGFKNRRADRLNFLSLGWLPRGVVFPKGWKRFYSALDYKLGVNFDEEAVKNVQDCPHEFDLKLFENWEPNFEEWSPK